VWGIYSRGIRDVFYAHSSVGNRAFGDTFLSFDDN